MTDELGPFREVSLRGKKLALQVLPTRYESNGEAGDGQTVCLICGEETDNGHTADECVKSVRIGIEASCAQVDHYKTEMIGELEGKIKDALAEVERLKAELSELKSQELSRNLRNMGLF